VLEALKKNKELEVTNSSPTNIEVNAIGINKAAALAKVSERLGFTMENVMAVGDSLNDIAMIKEAGLGVAMGNGQDIVKETADWITDTNNENGVAKAIRHWVLA
ncbi:HAD-IIB family hydrolase, partial [Klebsiella pneumoniae]|nr:HAD-IIB family hydrolase [Klebsiella pneumoniae]